jgi:hypothetical protein
VALLPFLVTALLTIHNYRVGRGYKQFTESLYQSALYGIEHEYLRAVYQGVSTKLSEKNALQVFSAIVSSRFLNHKTDYDKTDEMILDFGNGDRMWLYKQDSTTVVICYINADGDRKDYITTEITRMITFERLISEEWGNSLWE